VTAMSHPPLAPLGDVVARLRAAGIDVALGGSGLLAALGLETTVRDWDLTTDAAQDDVAATLASLSPVLVGSSGIHADSKVMLPALDLEVICRFAFVAGEGVIRIPTIATGTWNGVPLGSPEAWAVAYTLLGREPKAERLFRLLAMRGADEVTVERLMREPLPPALRARLRRLPPR
jgi:hypothetical protein